jgi:uncharacterized protein YwgA
VICSVLEDDVMARIFSFLDAKDIITASSVARKWRVINVAKQASIWAPLVAKLYQSHHIDDVKDPVDKFSLKTKTPYKRAYMDRLQEQKDWAHVREYSLVVEVPSEVCFI